MNSITSSKNKLIFDGIIFYSNLTFFLSQDLNVQLLRCRLPHQAWCDSWALIHWILADISPEPNECIEVASKRDEPTTFQHYAINVCNHTLNRRVMRIIRRSHVRSVEDWTAFVRKLGTVNGPWIVDDNYIINNFQQPRLLLPPFSDTWGDSFVTGLFPWVSFLNQSKFKAYYDVSEGIGVKSLVSFEQGEAIPELTGNLMFVGSDLAELPYPHGMRWSFFEDCYLGGPVSSVNCSCSNHRNVNLRPKTDSKSNTMVMDVISDWCINEGDKIYAAYNNDMSGMRITRGIRCPFCL